MRETPEGKIYMICQTLRPYILLLMIIYVLIYPHDSVDLKGNYHSTNWKYIYIIADLTMCAPLLYLFVTQIVYLYFVKYKIIGTMGIAFTALNALGSVFGNQREFLSILALNRVRRYYVSSTYKEASLYALNDHT
jgi:hypothetical protein